MNAPRPCRTRPTAMLAVLIAALALLAACGDDDDGPVPTSLARLQCTGPTSTVFPSEEATITAAMTDGAGRPFAGRVLRWTSSGGPGALIGPRGDTVDKTTTDADGKSSVKFSVAFDAGFKGEVTVTAETADSGATARCEVRFQANSPGLPTPAPRR